jgi:hypothetical protein
MEATGARGLIAKAGRYGGTFAHRDIQRQNRKWLIRIAPEMAESPQSPRHPLHLRSARIVRNRQMKFSNRQITRIHCAANPVEFDGIELRVRNACRVFEKGGFSRSGQDRLLANGICKERGLSKPRQSLMAGWETSHPARETDKTLKKILEKIGV